MKKTYKITTEITYHDGTVKAPMVLSFEGNKATAEKMSADVLHSAGEWFPGAQKITCSIEGCNRVSGVWKSEGECSINRLG